MGVSRPTGEREFALLFGGGVLQCRRDVLGLCELAPAVIPSFFVAEWLSLISAA